MARDAQLAGTRMGLNYGFDRVRFPSPVPAGGRIRGRFVTWHVTAEIERRERPALVADWISRRYLARAEMEGTR